MFLYVNMNIIQTLSTKNLKNYNATKKLRVLLNENIICYFFDFKLAQKMLIFKHGCRFR